MRRIDDPDLIRRARAHAHRLRARYMSRVLRALFRRALATPRHGAAKAAAGLRALGRDLLLLGHPVRR